MRASAPLDSCSESTPRKMTVFLSELSPTPNHLFYRVQRLDERGGRHIRAGRYLDLAAHGTNIYAVD